MLIVDKEFNAGTVKFKDLPAGHPFKRIGNDRLSDSYLMKVICYRDGAFRAEAINIQSGHGLVEQANPEENVVPYELHVRAVDIGYRFLKEGNEDGDG